MKWFGKDDDGCIRVAGLPVSDVWRGDTEALLDGFEPENPSLLVPRKYGLGWSLNVGAVAVKAGWIRPDDSLPDLADHVPVSLRKAISVAPLIGGMLTVGLSVLVAQKKNVAIKWSLFGMPTKFSRGSKAALPPVLLNAAVALLPRLTSQKAPLSQTAVDISARAEVLGVQTMSVATLLAASRSARQPAKRQLLAIAAPLFWPIVSGGIQIACVKTALSNIEAELQNTHEER
ncbi:hypothetical protein BSR28_06320 [Boudabousia liubingyangii]|uniref:DUF5808 domain-containing protein n=1 Tax=Boudabousia liubingyangii TaxID=1921764 RepID=UPI00093C0656|nr:DUF5808 domain-containing protein [Boudabousia liubingyangii]OKL47026.1 hypothetical protein BSR28_06320 [Boudabousia liubingyangii]